MYDVKQADPSEWSSPPFEARLVDKPGFGKVVVGRARSIRGPRGRRCWRPARLSWGGTQTPVNLVFVAEGEEEIGSPHFPQIVHRPDVLAAFRKCTGVYMPMPKQSPDGRSRSPGGQGHGGTGARLQRRTWGRGPKQDLHSSNEARVDSPAWHLVQALDTLVGPDGHTPAIDGSWKSPAR